MTKTIYHPVGDENPATFGADELTHVEVDPQGQTHVWPYVSQMRNRLYHPEWRVGYVAPERRERPTRGL